ncbi:Uroporphyrinogen decarboxylase [Acididesulfobacillus acetoxydans]|uniref:Uroporphyrinogen decarboxylase n=1 Tax=Acididesulfobacillus acetoxydans TaxID=1561005 RepID=A0A8S0XX02_9FIRM|nr:Uroporphyrinogen decarboxylase [Acididesulfobacillus acetoxydans]CEJ07452.1 Uroporphyrinogen decarboxylase (URO-D) [Acididesulfobacillus acetoxydans]
MHEKGSSRGSETMEQNRYRPGQRAAFHDKNMEQEGCWILRSKERVQMALSHEEPDRVPFTATYVPEVVKRLRAVKGEGEYDVGVAMGNDCVKTAVGLEMSFYGSNDPEYTCKWGIRWRNVTNYTGHYTEIIDHPLAGDESQLDSFQIPDPLEESQYDDCRKIIKRYGKEKWIIGSCQISIFEASWYLRGLDQFMMDMALNKDYAHALMDKVMQFPLKAAKKYIQLGVDMVWFGDDVATQTNMMISPPMWREYLKPRYAKIFEECKKTNPNTKIAYHSCGNCEAIIPEMIEIGLDVLNPIQPASMNPFEIKRKYGKDICLFGGLDVQHTMPFGTPELVRTDVKRLIEGCGKGGGYILSPAHHIQSDTSNENIFAFYAAADTF